MRLKFLLAILAATVGVAVLRVEADGPSVRGSAPAVGATNERPFYQPEFVTGHTKVHRVTATQPVTFKLEYFEGSALAADNFYPYSEDFRSPDSLFVGRRVALERSGAVAISPGGWDGAAKATFTLVSRLPNTRGYPRTTDVTIPLPSGRLTINGGDGAELTDVVDLPVGTYRARLSSRGRKGREELRVALRPR